MQIKNRLFTVIFHQVLHVRILNLYVRLRPKFSSLKKLYHKLVYNISIPFELIF